MKVSGTILSRRSIRKYTEQKVEQEKINLILKAGMYAPSAFNLQAWEFIVVDNKKILLDLLTAAPHAEMLKQASHAIIVCADIEKEKSLDLAVQNCSAAVQNMLLEIHELGLGGCWIGVHPFKEIVEAIKNFFSLPEYIIPIAMISTGYPGEAPEAEERYKEQKVHFNKW